MKADELSRIPSKVKKEFLNNIFLMYRKFFISDQLLTTLGKFDARTTSLKKHQEGVKNQLTIFHAMMDLLDEPHRLIISKEFIEQENNSLWYEEHWSKSMYYKLKNEAYDRVLTMIYV